MSRPTLEVADIIRASGSSFWERQGSHLAWQHRKVMDAIVRCRTATLGGHRDQCLRCGHQAISYNSCRNRHCPKCQGNARSKWLAARSAELLPVPYFHVVFTLPHELSALVLQNKRLLYDLLFRTSAVTLLEVAHDPKHLGADIGLLCVLHTWGQNLQHHPHVHLRRPRWRTRGRWLRMDRYVATFLPARSCSQSRLPRQVHGCAQAALPSAQAAVPRLAPGTSEAGTLPSVHASDLCQGVVVYAKPPFGGAEHLLHYLARYTHRVAISNHRLVDYKDAHVSFRWKDYVCGGKQKVMTVSADEFLRRFLIHVLPRGLVRIRHFGLFASRRRAASLLRCRALLGATAPLQQLAPSSHTRCSVCSGDMLIIERMTGAQLHFRSALILSNAPRRRLDSS
jgi:hypothetical protein